MSLLWLALTIFVEFPVYLVFFRSQKWWMLLGVCALVNGVTHPIASALYMDAGLPWLAIELGVILVEGLLLGMTWKGNWKRAFVVAVLANVVTAGLGWVIGKVG